jgi:hypothetical protein
VSPRPARTIQVAAALSVEELDEVTGEIAA